MLTSLPNLKQRLGIETFSTDDDPLLTSLLRAKEYIFSGDRISAQTAVELGLANRVVPSESLLDDALALADRLAQQPARALQDSKRALNLHLQRAVATSKSFGSASGSVSPSKGERASSASFRTA